MATLINHDQDGDRARAPQQSLRYATERVLTHLGFHRITARWFADRFASPTKAQMQGWPAIRRGQDTLIAAPTGSGKTLTAFLVCIDDLLRQSLQGTLKDETKVLYVSPLKALSNDVRKNLEIPLAEIAEAADREGHAPCRGPRLRAAVRTGDTPSSQRQSMLKKPPHILVTTPESLFLLLTSDKGRTMLATVETVIVDEIHALARDKRGSHLALSLERLAALCGRRPVRIGLSATQKPLERVAAYLVGTSGLDAQGTPPCAIVDTMEQRTFDLAIEVPPSPLATVCSQEQWEEIYARLRTLIETHQSTIVFVNTRKLAERVAFHLSQSLGEDAVQSHHGSLSKDLRLAAEERLKGGRIKAIVATASLELGIDVGTVDLVCQIGSPRSISTFLQRIGRSGHAVGGTPKGRLFALTRDELLEALALIRAVRAGELDQIQIPEMSLDILAQQLIAEAAAREISVSEMAQMVRQAYPYRHLTNDQLGQVISMLSRGFAPGRRKSAYLHYDGTKDTLRARSNARLAATMSGGAIPEQGDFRVVTEEDGTFVGSVNEEFAIESSRGDIFLLGNTSWQLVGLRGTDVVVRDAQGAPPTIPFWQGESPGRTVELSLALAALRSEIASRIALPDSPDDPVYQLEALQDLRLAEPAAYAAARRWVETDIEVDPWVSLQAVHFVAVQKAAHGLVPSQKEIVFERFFDESGGMQLVIHAPFGMRINKGFGLALRKCFCRSFDFELQASADNDGIVLSLGPQHSFPIEHLFKMLNPRNVQALLEQAILQVPLFNIRWRWNTTRSLAVLRTMNGKRVPPVLQRFRAEDLMTAVFPQQTQCKEHVTGDIPLPDHPLVQQTMMDCLHEAIDLEGLKALLARIESGEVTLVARETREPSPFAYQLLNAYPYAFLDDAPLEERRARAVALRRTLPLDQLKDLGRLDQSAISEVSREAWPEIRSADELFDTLGAIGVLPEADTRAEATWTPYFEALIQAGRATRVLVPVALGSSTEGPRRDRTVVLWTTVEHLGLVRAAYGEDAIFEPPLQPLPEALDGTTAGFGRAIMRDQEPPWERETAWLHLIKGYLDIRAILDEAEIAQALALDAGAVAASLPALEAQGDILRGPFRGDGIQWCPRRLLARMQRLTIEGLRQGIKPATVGEYYGFLMTFQHLAPGTQVQGREGLAEVLEQLSGFDAPAGAWEKELLGARVADYQPAWLDELTYSGRFVWGRLTPPWRSEHREDREDREDQENHPRTGGDEVVDQSDDQSAEAPLPARSGGPGMTRVVPIALAPREDLPWILPRDRVSVPHDALDYRSQAVLAALQKGGAQFPQELRRRSGLLESELEGALGELARQGLVTADGFGAIRPLVQKRASAPAYARPPRGYARPQASSPAAQGGGRWSLFPGPLVDEEVQVAPTDRVERWARLLLKRYGVVCRELLTRETAAPRWSELARTYRVLEARGEVRGGRFVTGLNGEQFALPAAADQLRAAKNQPRGERPWAVIAAADPLNLVGILTKNDERIASSRTVMMVVQDGDVVATRERGVITFTKEVTPDIEGRMREALQLSGIFRARQAACHLRQDVKIASLRSSQQDLALK